MRIAGECFLCHKVIDLHNDLWDNKQTGADSKGKPIYEKYHKDCSKAHILNFKKD